MTEPVDGMFLTAASPGVVALFQTDKHYNSHQEYVGALVPELAKEYRKGQLSSSLELVIWFSLVIDSDVVLQLDCPDLAMGRHHAYSK